MEPWKLTTVPRPHDVARVLSLSGVNMELIDGVPEYARSWFPVDDPRNLCYADLSKRPFKGRKPQ